MKNNEEYPKILTRGAYIAPWLDPEHGRPSIVVIDRRGCCIYQMIQQDRESEDEALRRAQALLDLLDHPAETQKHRA
jgi:hypothetical protein